MRKEMRSIEEVVPIIAKVVLFYRETEQEAVRGYISRMKEDRGTNAVISHWAHARQSIQDFKAVMSVSKAVQDQYGGKIQTLTAKVDRAYREVRV